MNMMKKTVIASGIALALGSPGAFAAAVNDVTGAYNFNTVAANFTLLTSDGYSQSGFNNVSMSWDGNAFNASSDYTGPGSVSNITASSTGYWIHPSWDVHDIQVFVPGTYSFDTTLGPAPAGMVNSEGGGIMNVTVPDGYLGAHMLFDWGSNANVDVFFVLAQNSMYGDGVVRTSSNASLCDGTETSLPIPNITNCLWGGSTVPGFEPTDNQLWQLATVDGDGDGIMGIAMIEGPLAGFNLGFNANFENITPDPVPVPVAAWLFGSGLLGLAGVARRKRAGKV